MRTKTAAQGLMPDLPHLAVEDTLFGAELALPCANLLLCSRAIQEAIDSLHSRVEYKDEGRVQRLWRPAAVSRDAETRCM